MEVPQLKFTLEQYRFDQVLKAGIIEEGDELTLRYDSNFGGVQEVSGEAEFDEFTGKLSVGDRTIRGKRVHSSSRDVGELIEVELVMPQGRALDAVTLHTDGHDIDAGDDVVIVQSWEGSHKDDSFHGYDDVLEVL